MKPPIFDYVTAESQEHALDVLRQHGDDAKVLAGGQSLVPLMSFRLAKPALLLDINGLDGLDSVKAADGHLTIGALTRQCELLTRPLIADRCPLMRAATEFIGHPAIRNRGTVGGSVAHADPAAELPILLQVLDADIEVCSADSRRTIPAGDFFMGLLTTGMNPDELLTGISIPLPERGPGWGFHEVARRHGDFALVAAAALVTPGRPRSGGQGGGGPGWHRRPAATSGCRGGSAQGQRADPGSNRSRLAAGRRLGHAHGRHPRRRSLSRPSGTGSDQTCHTRRRGACPGFLIGKKQSAPVSIPYSARRRGAPHPKGR